MCDDVIFLESFDISECNQLLSLFNVSRVICLKWTRVDVARNVDEDATGNGGRSLSAIVGKLELGSLWGPCIVLVRKQVPSDDRRASSAAAHHCTYTFT